MRYGILFAAVAVSSGFSSAYAHAHLRASIPADGSVLQSAPAQLVMQLSEPAKLTALSIQRGSEKPRPLSAPEQAATQIRIGLPALTSGKYLVHWRALSEDGHVTSGTLHFTLQP